MKAPTYSTFSNKKHLINFLKYLFRTDPKEKWSNENTNSNIYVFPKGGERYSQSTLKSRTERRELMKATKSVIAFRAGETPMEEYIQNLQMVLIDGKSTEKLISRLHAAVELPEHILVAVIHRDQGGNHLHAIVEKELTVNPPSFTLIKEE